MSAKTNLNKRWLFLGVGVFTMLFSMFVFPNVAVAADFELNNQKAYVEMPRQGIEPCSV